jgi:predicted DNA-binding protein (MmcQ/YjbR family)
MARPEATEDFPFGAEAAVYRVRGKIFAILSEGKTGVEQVNLKCDPDQALALRDFWQAVIPGYHMNKKHWNTVILDDSIPDPELERMIDHSYALVAKSLKKVERQALVALYGEKILEA